MRYLTMCVLLFLLVVVGTTASYAQPGGDRSAQLLERLKTDLSLSDSVTAKVDSILKIQRKNMADARDKFGDDREGMMSAMREQREKSDKAIEALLTQEQVEKYRKIREEMRANFRGGARTPRN